MNAREKPKLDRLRCHQKGAGNDGLAGDDGGDCRQYYIRARSRAGDTQKGVQGETTVSGAFRSALAAVILIIFVPGMAAPQASEPPLIGPDEGPWELDGGFKFKKKEETRRALSGVACLPASRGQRRCLAVFDEGGEARRLTLADHGYSTDNKSLVLLPGKAELDAEGATTDGRYFYVTGSHGAKQENCVNNPDSRHVIRFPVEASPNGSSADLSVTGALWTIMKGVPELTESVDVVPCEKASNTDSQKRGVNIEGLAVKDGRLFFGFRSPAVGGAAKILSVDVERLFSGGGADPKLFTLFLGPGRAVRDLSPVSDGILVLAGPDEAETSKDAGWAVARWNPKASEAVVHPKILGRLDLKVVEIRPCDKKIKPEALAVTEDEAGKPYRAVIFSDGMCDGGPLIFTIPR